MCGIVGIYSANQITSGDKSYTEQMLNLIRHRGPDGSEISAKKQAILGMVRLSMVDSVNESVLLYDEEYKLTLAFNGEIYNYTKLREELIQNGFRFKSNNDGEVILHLYKIYEHDLVSYLDGMFAFALWDDKIGQLILARDHMGIKPLYYYNIDNNLIFASELKAFSTFNESLNIDSYALSLYYYYRFIPAPYSIFKNIRKLEPGSCLVINQSGMQIIEYWKPRFGHTYRFSSSLKEIFNNSVYSTLMSDHMLGVFLSGGIDSGLILSALKQKPYVTEAFTIGYDINGTEDERAAASLIANYLGISHKSEIIYSNCIAEELDKIAWFLEEPLYSTVSISTYNLAKIAKKYVKGVLTGDGSDELFLSYNYLQTVLKLQNQPRDIILNDYIKQIGWLPDEHKTKLLDQSLLLKTQNIIEEFFNVVQDPLNAIRYFEIRHRLPDYHLIRVDKLTMAVGLEARVPFLRREIVEWCNQKSSIDLLIYNKAKNYLKNALSDYLPKNILLKDKQPFTTPIYQWLKTPSLKEEVYDLFKQNYTNVLGLKHNYLMLLINDFYQKDIDHSKVIWGIYLLLKWYKNCIIN